MVLVAIIAIVLSLVMVVSNRDDQAQSYRAVR